jgi:RNA polymerase sigma-70 factor, ECF subfamily
MQRSACWPSLPPQRPACWSSRANYRPQQGTVAAWLLTVVRYRAIDVARSKTAVKRDDAQRLLVSLELLPDAQAEVITLAYYGQLTHTEIATHLRLPAGTVKSRMRLGLRKLQAHI